MILVDKEINNCGIAIKPSPTKESNITGIKNMHFNLVNLDHVSLANLASIMKDKIQNSPEDGFWVDMCDEDDIRKMITTAVAKGAVDLKKCKNLAQFYSSSYTHYSQHFTLIFILLYLVYTLIR